MNKLLPRPNEGDWVKGISLNGEVFLGYVEAVVQAGDSVFVKVTESENDQAVGKTVISKQGHLQVLPLSASREEGHLLNWIDLALMMRDEQWFEKLTSQLIALREQQSQK